MSVTQTDRFDIVFTGDVLLQTYSAKFSLILQVGKPQTAGRTILHSHALPEVQMWRKTCTLRRRWRHSRAPADLSDVAATLNLPTAHTDSCSRPIHYQTENRAMSGTEWHRSFTKHVTTCHEMCPWWKSAVRTPELCYWNCGPRDVQINRNVDNK